MQEGGSQHGPPPPPPPVGSLPPPSAFEEEGPERGPPSANRWPRDETVALLKIRSEMDAEFRQATLKGPLWEEVSRRLAALGYSRSGKKCREKFENVHKYYRRTKDHRASRPDGKSYRFFTQLEALQNINKDKNNDDGDNDDDDDNINNNDNDTTIATNPSTAAALETTTRNTFPAPPLTIHDPIPISSIPPPSPGQARAAGSGSSAASDTEETDREGLRKRKRPAEGSRTLKMMAFFEGVMKEVMERQEAMQSRFLEAIERIEQERLLREENWRRQEAARNARESDAASRERAAAAARDAGIMALLQKIASRAPPAASQVNAPPAETPAVPVSQVAPLAVAAVASGARAEQPGLPVGGEGGDIPAAPTLAVVVAEEQLTETGLSGGGSEPASSRWPQEEVHALIDIRTSMESRYQEAGPKGPLWEEISAAMGRMDYKRTPKRCKEKWENINKYFKRVKDSNKKRSEASKTCPYFHQLDTIYRSKSLGGGSKTTTPTGTQMPPPTGQHPSSGSLEVEEKQSNGDRSPCPPEGGKEDATSGKKPEGSSMMDRRQNGSLSRWRDCNQMENGFYGSGVEDHDNVAKQGMSHRQLESLCSKASGSSSTVIVDRTNVGSGSTFLALWSSNGEDAASDDT